MTQHSTILSYGRCETTGKIKYASRADAKKVRERNPTFRDKRPYLCPDCNHVHLGGQHGTQSREDHRAGQVTGSTVSVRMAANGLCMSAEKFEMVIAAGAVDVHRGDHGQWRVPTTEVERLKKLTWKEPA